MVRLFDSVMRSYPTQTLLFWRTREAIKARKFMFAIDRDAELSTLYEAAKSRAGVEKSFVLDGQQRIQTLYAIFCGGMKATDGRDAEAYFDVTAGIKPVAEGDLMYEFVFSPEPLQLPFYRVRNLIEKDERKDAFTIAETLNDAMPDRGDSAETKARANQVFRNISQLSSVLRDEKHFWVEELDGVAESYDYRKILNIFVRVNTGGTKLTSAELMFASMKEGWEDIEEHINETVDMLPILS